MSHAYDDDTISARQVTPLTCQPIADWCAGTVSVNAAGNQGVDLADGGRADFGDWVVRAGDQFTVQDPVGFRREHLES